MKPENYWTKDKCLEEALKYKSLAEFRKHGVYAYVKSYKNNWLKDFYNGYVKAEIKWTKEECLKEASKYTNRYDFRTKSRTAYSIIIRNNWLDYLYFDSDKLSISYWTKDLCLEESKKYKTKTLFKKGSYQAYKSAYINCWLDEICEHMPKIGNLYKRCIYAFEFPDNNVYVGLTYNIDIREKQHYISSKSQVNKHYIESGLEPKLVKLTDYIDVNLAKIKEGEYIQNYKDNNWYILNSQKAGNIGGNNKVLTEERCKEIASKYVYLKDFKTEYPNVYKTIIRYKWYDCCDFLIKSVPTNKIKWTKEVCSKEALKYKTKTDFEEGNINAYNACVRNKWLNELCSHMISKTHLGSNPKWTYESCKEIASLYKTKNELKKNDNAVYQACLRNKWIDNFYKTFNK
jgi:hypothetical protein